MSTEKKAHGCHASLQEMVQKALSTTHYGKDAGGQKLKIDLAKIIIRAQFHEAAHGNAAALKTVMTLSKQYLPAAAANSEVQAHTSGYYVVDEIDVETIKFYKEFGYLPADCPDKPIDVGLKILKRAMREFLKDAEIARKNGGSPLVPKKLDA
jgi:hypothetical protein